MYIVRVRQVQIHKNTSGSFDHIEKPVSTPKGLIESTNDALGKWNASASRAFIWSAIWSTSRIWNCRAELQRETNNEEARVNERTRAVSSKWFIRGSSCAIISYFSCAESYHRTRSSRVCIRLSRDRRIYIFHYLIARCGRNSSAARVVCQIHATNSTPCRAEGEARLKNRRIKSGTLELIELRRPSFYKFNETVGSWRTCP